MLRKLTVFLIVALLALGINVQAVEAGNAMAEETIDVQVNIPVMQQMEIRDPAVVEYDFSEGEEEIVKENAGSVEIMSNADWQLDLDNFATGDVDVLVRRSDDSSSAWQSVEGINGDFQGTNGSEEVEFDVKVLPGSSAEAEGRVELGFTLQEI